MSAVPPLATLVASLPATVPFVGPEALERLHGARIEARLGANESVFGPSPKAIVAMQAAATDVWKYGDPELHELKAAIARHCGARADNIAIAGGIDGLLGLTVRLFVEPGMAVVTSLGAYPTFTFHVTGFGGRLVTVPYHNDHEDPDALLIAALRERPPLVYLANPDNPMGSCWPASTVLQLIERLPAGSLLCLDEAYGEFAPAGTLPDLDPDDARVLRFRTFSKAHGMAGLRVGYVTGAAPTITAFDRIRNHFGVGRIAQAGAIAALDDMEHLRDVVAKVSAARERIGAIARANGLTPLPSATNFVAIDCGSDGAFAHRVLDGLLRHGVFVRMPGVAPLNRTIRISAGTDADLDRLGAALPLALQAARCGAA